MKFICSYDYEIFFGKYSGDATHCLLEPTEILRRIASSAGIKLVFFVDTGYLLKLEEYSPKFPNLASDLKLITDQLNTLAAEGHELQLHIHPHWEKSVYDGRWIFDHSAYRLQSFSKNEISTIIKRNVDYFSHLSNVPKPTAFRAGGWCIQPFAPLMDALYDNGIFIDSSVVPGMTLHSATHNINFKLSPQDFIWHFSTDPLIKDDTGHWLEVPMESVYYSPFYYWLLILVRYLKLSKFRSWGNGSSVKSQNKKETLRSIICGDRKAISFDSLKGICANYAYKCFKSKFGNDSICTLIGHPKAHSEFSMNQFEKFVITHLKKGDEFILFRDLCKK